MSALRKWDINLLQTEKKTLFSFLFLYAFLISLIAIFVGMLYYNFEKDLMLQKKRIELQKYANDLIKRLKYLHYNFDKDQTYPRDKRFKSAIYDSDEVCIFSLLDSKKVDLNKIIYKKENKIIYIKLPEAYYLGAMYVVVEIEDDEAWLKKVYGNLIFYGSFFLALVLTIGYFLLNLFLKPMKDTIYLLDRFIKDTTHELNTPVSTILANIETIRKDDLDKKLFNKIRRIEVAAKTISNLYQDLTYLILHNKIISKEENVNISKLLNERVEYFKIIAFSKRVVFKTDIKENVYLFIDRKRFSRLIDNLLSNAIKYNKVGGEIIITLRDKYLSIKDTGIGIESEKIKEMFERYKRFDKSVGGFGIGLSIVSMIAKEYDLNIEIKSKVNEGTEVIVSWKK